MYTYLINSAVPMNYWNIYPDYKGDIFHVLTAVMSTYVPLRIHVHLQHNIVKSTSGIGTSRKPANLPCFTAEKCFGAEIFLGEKKDKSKREEPLLANL